jgi:hypothetical protein
LGPPKPPEHWPFVAAVIRTLVAATVPVASVVPCAVTHTPTLTDVEVVLASVVILVLELAVTVLLVGVELLDPML